MQCKYSTIFFVHNLSICFIACFVKKKMQKLEAPQVMNPACHCLHHTCSNICSSVIQDLVLSVCTGCLGVSNRANTLTDSSVHLWGQKVCAA